MQVAGTVARVWDKSITSKAGKAFKINYVEINGTPVNVGFKQPYSVGQEAVLQTEEKYGELKMVAQGAVHPVSTGQAPSKSPAAFPVAKNSRELAIIRQNSLTNAVNTFAATHKAAAGRTPLGDFADEIIELAYKYAEFSSGHREQRIAKEMAEGE